jgi:hypothetical protein
MTTHACGAVWNGTAAAHCGGCHETFSTVGNFDKHRRNGTCLDPVAAGLHLNTTRGYPVWMGPLREGGFDE